MARNEYHSGLVLVSLAGSAEREYGMVLAIVIADPFAAVTLADHYGSSLANPIWYASATSLQARCGLCGARTCLVRSANLAHFGLADDVIDPIEWLVTGA